MTIREVEVMLNGMAHTVQVNDDDPSGLKFPEVEQKAARPKNKAAKPAANKAADAVDDAPVASE